MNEVKQINPEVSIIDNRFLKITTTTTRGLDYSRKFPLHQVIDLDDVVSIGQNLNWDTTVLLILKGNTRIDLCSYLSYPEMEKIFMDYKKEKKDENIS